VKYHGVLSDGTEYSSTLPKNWLLEKLLLITWCQQSWILLTKVSGGKNPSFWMGHIYFMPGKDSMCGILCPSHSPKKHARPVKKETGMFLMRKQKQHALQYLVNIVSVTLDNY
jgi:hypothetical protein